MAPFLLGSLTVQSYICQPPMVPVVQQPSDSSSIVSGETIVIKGVSTASTRVTLSESGQVIATVTADENNNFSAQTTFLVGSHQIDTRADNPCGSEIGESIHVTATEPRVGASPALLPPATSNVHPFTLPTNLPGAQVTPQNPSGPSTISHGFELMITSSYDSSTAADSLFVTGQTNRTATERISINGTFIASSDVPQSHFGLSVPLAMGTNHITVVATSGTLRVSTTFSIERVAVNTSVVKSPAWYRTTPGKVVIVSAAIIIILVIVGLLLL